MIIAAWNMSGGIWDVGAKADHCSNTHFPCGINHQSLINFQFSMVEGGFWFSSKAMTL
jgi:hypothetical protein